VLFSNLLAPCTHNFLSWRQGMAEIESAAPAGREDDERAEGDEEGPKGPTHEPFSFKLMETVQKQQSSNGLRHNDHLRYRQYCSRRLRRLFNALRFKHGKGRFKNVPFPDDFQDVRFLEIPLVAAERAWSYGVQLKADNAAASVLNPQWRHHSIQRFSKAVKWGQMLEAVCKIHADQRTQMEAEAYTAFLDGVYLVEKEEWSAALGRISRCKKVCEYLSLASNSEEGAFLKAKAQELAPLLRECKYNLGMAYDGNDDDDDKPRPAGAARADMSGLSYRGQHLAVPSDKIQDKLSKCLQMVSEVKVDGEDRAVVIEKYGEVSVEFGDVLKDIHSDMIQAGADGQTAEWKMLEAFARQYSISMNAKRNLLLLLGHFEKLERLEEVTSVDARRACRPEEGTRFCDMLQDAIFSLEELPEKTPEIASALSAYKMIVQNCRCLFMALCYASLGKTLESAALLDMLRARVDDVELGDALPDPLGRLHVLFERLQAELPTRVIQWRCRGLATLSASAAKDGETGGAPQKSTGLEEHGFAVFPPQLREVPCKPLLFDLAFPCIEPPDFDKLESKNAGADDKKGLLRRVAGGIGSFWGRK